MAVGYRFLLDHFQSRALPPRLEVEVRGDCHKVLRTSTSIIIPKNLVPNKGPFSHLLFAVKHEGIDLGILADVLPKIDPSAIYKVLKEKPASIFARKLGYLWETFTGKELEDVCPRGNYVDLFDEEKYFTGPRMRNQKWRVDLNGLGSLKYCPVVEKTEKLKKAVDKKVLEQVCEWRTQLDPNISERLAEGARIKELKASFALEREDLSYDRVWRLQELFKDVKEAPLTEESLCDWQRKIVNSEYSEAFGFRREQNWLSCSIGRGPLSVTYIPPAPQLLSSLMEGWLDFAKANLLIDPIVKAAILSFGFVFLHPFMDGNGRVSRLLIHRELSCPEHLTGPMILPLSMAFKRNERLYFEALRAFSVPARKNWKVSCGAKENEFDFEFLGSPMIYRYWNATAQAEFLFDMAEEVLNVDLKDEAQYLGSFDRLFGAINDRYNVSQSTINILISSVLNSRGRLSQSIRDRFKGKVPPEIFEDIEESAKIYAASPGEERRRSGG